MGMGMGMQNAASSHGALREGCSHCAPGTEIPTAPTTHITCPPPAQSDISGAATWTQQSLVSAEYDSSPHPKEHRSPCWAQPHVPHWAQLCCKEHTAPTAQGTTRQQQG